MTTGPGRCPRCEREGSAGDPCADATCARLGLHCIPEAYVRPHGRAGDDPLIGRSIDDALVVSRLGVGGFGRVYLALQQPFGMKLALKLLDVGRLTPEMRDIGLRTFENEARALAALSHPNLVRLVRYGLFDDTPYLALEFVENAVTLEEEIETRAQAGRRFEVDEVRDLVEQALDGLAAAHARELVHRDLKPANLMLQVVPGHPRLVRLLDFGLAKDISAGGDTAYLTGTPEFMAPEQILQRGIGPWTDLYALAVVAFELLTGRTPFSGTSYEVIFAQKLDRARDPVDVVAGDEEVPEAWRDFFRLALAREPAARFPDTETFRLAFREALAAPLPEATGRGPGRDLRALLTNDALEAVPEADAGRDRASLRLEREARRAQAFRSWLEHDGQRLADAARTTPDVEPRRREPPAWDARNPLFGRAAEPPWEQRAGALIERGRAQGRRRLRRRVLRWALGAAALAAAVALGWWLG